MQIDEDIQNQQRIAQRELGTIAYERENRPPWDLSFGHRLERIRAAADELRRIGGSDQQGWLAATDQTIGELSLLTEVVALLQREVEVERAGTMILVPALDSFDRNWEHSPEHAARAWDAIRQLIGPLEDPRFAAVPEAAAVVARYRAIAPRAVELPARVAAERARPLIAEASSALDGLRRAIDNGDEDVVRRIRAELMKLVDALPAVPEAEPIQRAAHKALARSEEEIGAHLALEEIEAIERVLEPLVEQVERGLEQRAEERVIAHAPRVAAWRPRLRWHLHHPRAQRLSDRAAAALARIATLGPEVERACAAAEAVPVIPHDASLGTRVEALELELEKAYAAYRASYQETQARFETEIDLVGGTPSSASYHVINDIDSAAREMVRFARRGEEVAAQLAELAPGHPALAVVEAATTPLIRRVQTWKGRLAALVELSSTLDEARQWFDRARETADAGADSNHGALMVWPEVIQHVGRAEEALARAAEQLPDEPERFASWRAKLAAMRVRAVEQLAGACIAEATRNAKLGDLTEAQRFADALREAAPDAVENQQIAAMLAGTADAREQAALEIEAHGALIRRAAEDAARSARSAYDAWVADRAPVTTLAGTIVANLDQFRGKWIAGRCSHLGLSLADEPGAIRGDMYQIDYDPEVRRHLAEGMARLDGMFESRAKQTAAAAGVDGLRTTTQHYPSDASYHAEIVGLATYTPVHEVRDVHGSLLATYTGTPYPVPRIVIRAVATRYFVIVPGEPPSLDAMTIG